MIAICLAVYVVLGLGFICSLAFAARCSTPQPDSAHEASIEVRPVLNEEPALRHAA